MPHRPQGVSEAIVNGNCRAGTCNIFNSVLAIVRVGPDQFSRFPRKTVNPFHLFRFRKTVSNVDAPVCDAGAAIAATDGHSPADRDLGSVKRFQYPGFAPDSVPCRSSPLRPFVGQNRRDGNQHSEQQ